MSNFKRIMGLCLLMGSFSSNVVAQQPANPPPPSPNVAAQQPANPAPPSPQSTSQQFQQWLQTNGFQATAGQTPTVPSGTSAQLTAQTPPPPSTAMTPPPTPHKPHKPVPLTYEQSQEVMLNSVPPSKIAPTPDSMAAFNLMMQKNMPLSPEQVVLLRQQIDIAQRAAAVPPSIPPKPVSTTLMINLAPGTTPPAVRLAQGYVSSLVFVDSTGTPWPIAAYDIGNPKAVNIQWDGKSNILLLQAVSPYSDGDIVIRLAGLPTPVTLELVSGQRVVDYRVDIHVAGIGPNTKDLPLGSGLPESANQLLLNVLDGVPPPDSRLLYVRGGGNCQAWLAGDKMYLRTRLTVLSPGWIGKMTSPDGMQAYEMQRASSVLVSRYGEPIELKIEGF